MPNQPTRKDAVAQVAELHSAFVYTPGIKGKLRDPKILSQIPVVSRARNPFEYSFVIPQKGNENLTDKERRYLMRGVDLPLDSESLVVVANSQTQRVTAIVIRNGDGPLDLKNKVQSAKNYAGPTEYSKACVVTGNGYVLRHAKEALLAADGKSQGVAAVKENLITVTNGQNRRLLVIDGYGNIWEADPADITRTRTRVPLYETVSVPFNEQGMTLISPDITNSTQHRTILTSEGTKAAAVIRGSQVLVVATTEKEAGVVQLVSGDQENVKTEVEALARQLKVPVNDVSVQFVASSATTFGLVQKALEVLKIPNINGQRVLVDKDAVGFGVTVDMYGNISRLANLPPKHRLIQAGVLPPEDDSLQQPQGGHSDPGTWLGRRNRDSDR